jgi:hypothetical protein
MNPNQHWQIAIMCFGRRSGDVDSQALEFVFGLGLYLVVFGDAE